MAIPLKVYEARKKTFWISPNESWERYCGTVNWIIVTKMESFNIDPEFLSKCKVTTDPVLVEGKSLLKTKTALNSFIRTLAYLLGKADILFHKFYYKMLKHYFFSFNNKYYTFKHFTYLFQKLEKSVLVLGENAQTAVIYGLYFSFKAQLLRVSRRKKRKFFPAFLFRFADDWL